MSRDILNINGKQPSQVSDTPRQKWTGVLGSPRRLAAPHHWSHSSGPLSPSVSRTPRFAGSRMPSGTLQGFRQDIDRRIVISIHHQATMRTHVRAHTKRLVHSLATPRTVLRGELRGDGNDRNVMQPPIVVDPCQEPSPRCITDGLGKPMVLDEVLYLQVFIGNQVARRDKRACRFPGKVLTLPTHFQIRSCQPLPSLVAVLALFLFRRYSTVQAFQFLFGLAQEPRVLYRMPLRVGVERFQPHVDPHLFPCGLMHDLTLRLHTELDEVAVRTAHETYSFDILEGKRLDVLLLIPDESQTSDATPVCEGDVLAIRGYFPARVFVLDRSIIVLELGIALLAWFVLAAIVIEPRDSGPCTICCGLTGLGVETAGKGVLVGQLSTRTLQIVLGGPASIHPEAQTLVADELHGADGLLDGGILCGCSGDFVFVGLHRASCPFVVSLLSSLYVIVMLYVKQGGTRWTKYASTSISRHASNGNWHCELRANVCRWPRSSDGPWIPTWRGMIPRMPRPSPLQKGRPVHPPDESRRLSWLAFCKSRPLAT